MNTSRRNKTIAFLGIVFFASILVAIYLINKIPSAQIDALPGDSIAPNESEPRVLNPDIKTFVDDNTSFAIDLYRKLSDSKGNLFFSPYSISSALAMTYAGARGETEKQMACALHFSLPQEKLHPAFRNLATDLTKIQSKKIKLYMANSLWPQKDYKFKKEYLTLVSSDYNSKIFPVDFEGATETARKKINRWVEDKTQDKIKDMLPPGVLDKLARLVLVDAVYFKGDWERPFELENTHEEPFLSPDTTMTVQMMYQKAHFNYAQIEDLQILEIPYAAKGISMIILLPTKNNLRPLESKLSSENLNRWRSQMQPQTVEIDIPKTCMTSTLGLKDTLTEMGMADAFAAKADFSGMDGTRQLHIDKVLHKAFVNMDEKGTEAAAATGVVMIMLGASPFPVPTFRADHPFILLIQENQTGSILFMGRVTNPNAGPGSGA